MAMQFNTSLITMTPGANMELIEMRDDGTFTMDADNNTQTTLRVSKRLGAQGVGRAAALTETVWSGRYLTATCSLLLTAGATTVEGLGPAGFRIFVNASEGPFNVTLDCYGSSREGHFLFEIIGPRQGGPFGPVPRWSAMAVGSGSAALVIPVAFV
jgi:hypothetical protein